METDTGRAELPEPPTEIDRPVTYEIRIGGRLGPQWAGWFDDLAIAVDESGATCLTGLVADHPALFGLLKKVRDLGIPLLSVNIVQPNKESKS